MSSPHFVLRYQRTQSANSAATRCLMPPYDATTPVAEFESNRRTTTSTDCCHSGECQPKSRPNLLQSSREFAGRVPLVGHSLVVMPITSANGPPISRLTLSV